MNKFVKVATGAALSAALIVGGAAAGAQAYNGNGKGTTQNPTIKPPKASVKGHKVTVKGTVKAGGTAAGATVKIVFMNKNGKVVKTVTVKTTKGGKYTAPAVKLPKKGTYTVATKVLDKGKYGDTKTKTTSVKIKAKK
jgi:hypothetical protein